VSVDLISDALPFGGLSYGGPNAINHAIGYAKHRSRSHHAVIRVYDAAGNMINDDFPGLDASSSGDAANALQSEQRMGFHCRLELAGKCSGLFMKIRPIIVGLNICSTAITASSISGRARFI
jgi:hypothetical protein